LRLRFRSIITKQREKNYDLHVWIITSGIDAMSAHVTVEDSSQGDSILAELQRVLKDQFKIEHTTIQLAKECCEEKEMTI